MSLADLHSLVLQSPLSQLPSVLTDLRSLLAASSSSGANPRLADQFEASLPDLLKRFHEEQGKVIRLPGVEDGSLLASEAVEEDEETHALAYRDASKSKRFTVDHLQGQATSSESYRPSPTSLHDLRSKLDEHLQVYLRDHYPDLDKQRTNEGACGQVWQTPPRKLQVKYTKLVHKETQKTTQEEAMAEKLEEDKEAQRQTSGESDAEIKTSSTNGESTVDLDIEKETYGTAMAQQDHRDIEGTPQGTKDALDTTAEKELRPEEAYEDEQSGEEEEEGELVEEAELSSSSSQPPRYVIKIVSGKSNAGNFWSGRLLSSYVYTPSEGTLEATLKIQIHYYENGNVQLNTLNKCNIAVNANSADADADAQAKSVIGAIRKYEASYQDLLSDTYDSLNEKAFKSLRRVLPVTRQKVDWDKVLNYRLGSDLADAQAK